MTIQAVAPAAASKMPSTMMASTAPAMQAESTYLKLLNAAASFKVSGSTLTLYDEGGNESLIYTAVT